MIGRLKSLFGGPEPVEAEPSPVAAPIPPKPPRQMVEPQDILPAEPDGFDVARSDPSGEVPGALPRDAALEERVIEAMKTVRDPEIPVNLIDLGLIYDLDIGLDGKVAIEMTLTTPNCPSAAELPSQIETAVRGVEGVSDVRVKIVFTPPWTPDRMSEEARLELGML